MYYKKYESERIYLAPISIDELETFTRWVNDETLARGIGNFKYSLTEMKEKEWLEHASQSENHNFMIIRKSDNKLIGSYGLDIKDSVSRRFHIGGFIGDIEDRGKGYGTDALKLVTKFAFEILNAKSIYSGIYSFNEASLKSAKKAGYTVAGKYRDACFYNGEFYDEYCIEITRDDYLTMKEK